MMLNKRSLLQNAIKSIAAISIITPSTAILMACTENKLQFKAIDITGADYAKDFAADGAMLDHNGKPRSIKDFAGKVVVLFFGYTQCPDVCPTSMAELAEVKKLLENNKKGDGDKLQGLFITIDPERDTPEVLKAYMGNFDPTFLACAPRQTSLLLWPKTSKPITKRLPAEPRPATPWTTRPAATCLTPRATCASTPVTAAVQRHWHQTSLCCLNKLNFLGGKLAHTSTSDL